MAPKDWMQSIRLRCENPLLCITVKVLLKTGSPVGSRGGDDDDGDAGDFRVTCFFVQHLEAVDVGHIEVEQH